MNDDLISRKALKEDFETLFYNDCGDFVRTERLIDDAPTVEYPFYAEAYQTGYEEGKNERPKGKWRSVGFEKGYAFCICSNCGNTTRLYRDSKNEFCCIADIRNKVIACLYCGADMRSVVDEGLHERAISDLSKAVDDAYKKARGDV